MNRYSQQAANNFLNNLRQTQPVLYKAAMARVKSPSTMGQTEEEPGIWGNIWEGIKDVSKSAFDYALSREQAEAAEKAAKRQAERDIAEMERQLELERRQLETMRASAEMKRQQAAILAAEKRELDRAKSVVSGNNTLLWLGGGAALLVAVMAVAK